MVMMCSNDEETSCPVGDARTETIHEIWHGEVMTSRRSIHNQPDGFKTIDICRRCYYPRKVVCDEVANVGEREVRVENYVNRNQSVGK
jgi:hypothetical protein